MSKRSYERLLRARCSYFNRNRMSYALSKQLEAVLALPHPDRENEFVKWCQNPKQFDRVVHFLDLDQVVDH